MSSLIARALAGPKRRVTIVDASVDPARVLTLDASVNETHTKTAQITRHPIEDGGDVVDHINPDPDTVEIVGVVSDDPIVILPALNRRPSITGGNPESRATDAYKYSVDLRDSRRVVRVLTTLEQYSDMALESFTTTRDKDTGRVLQATWRFVKIQFAVTDTVKAPKTTPERQPQQNKGKQSTTPATPEQSSSASQSVLFGLFGG